MRLLWSRPFPRSVLLACFFCQAALVHAGESPKVICAARAETPPVIDGVLDDACWQKAEVRDDFTDVVFGKPMPRRTAMRFVYDDAHLYMGLECEWDDARILKAGIARIHETHDPKTKTPVPIGQYTNRYGVELFVDPGASQANYFQILFNAGGQLTGNYKAIWDAFHLKPTFKGTVAAKGWTVEFALPVREIAGARLRPGDEWGLNVCRNDETYYSLWRRMGSNYHEPKAFGRLVVGDYRQWWNAVWARHGAARLGRLEPYSHKEPSVGPLYRLVSQRARQLSRAAQNHPPTDRKSFERVYGEYTDFRRLFDRLEAVCRTLEAIERGEGTP